MQPGATLFFAHKYAIFYPRVKAFTRGFRGGEPEAAAGGATRPLGRLRRPRRAAARRKSTPKTIKITPCFSTIQRADNLKAVLSYFNKTAPQ